MALAHQVHYRCGLTEAGWNVDQLAAAGKRLGRRQAVHGSGTGEAALVVVGGVTGGSREEGVKGGGHGRQWTTNHHRGAHRRLEKFAVERSGCDSQRIVIR